MTERIYAWNGSNYSPAIISQGTGQCPLPTSPNCNGTGGWWQNGFPVTLATGVVWTSPANNNELMGHQRSLKAYGQYFAANFTEW